MLLLLRSVWKVFDSEDSEDSEKTEDSEGLVAKVDPAVERQEEFTRRWSALQRCVREKGTRLRVTSVSTEWPCGSFRFAP